MSEAPQKTDGQIHHRRYHTATPAQLICHYSRDTIQLPQAVSTMTSIVPSRLVLRHLQRLCAPRSRPIPECLRSQRGDRSSTPLLATPLRHTTSKSFLQATRKHSFTTSTRRARPSTSDSIPPSAPSTPDITNHYTLFPLTLPHGPPPASPFALSRFSLRKEFLALQSQHHPDKHPAGSPHHRSSLALSSLLNTAYRTLSDPLLRAQYLLQLQYGIDVLSEDNGAHPTDQATLMEVMEMQEQIEGARSEEEIQVMMEENRMRIEETVERMAGMFEQGDGKGAERECVRLKYWRSLQEGLESWEEGREVRLFH